MKRYIYLFALSALYFSQTMPVVASPVHCITLQADTTDYDKIEELKRDTATMRIQRDTIAVNAPNIKYVMEDRFLNDGDTFTKKWYDHLFLQGGLGTEKMVSAQSHIVFDPLLTGHLGIGKQFNKLHSVRATLNGGYGFQQQTNRAMWMLTGRLDHLFSLSSYFNGYNPARLLDVSTVVGVGAQYSHWGHSSPMYYRGRSLEMHMGMQFRFFTGPQGYINIEPYAGIATSHMDLEMKYNWQKMDFFYGASVNFIYYINNNLSPEQRRRFIDHRTEKNLMADSLSLYSWHTPWFFEASNGLSLTNSSQLSLSSTLGHEASFAFGRWFSSAIGVRVAASATTTSWLKSPITGTDSEVTTSHERTYHAGLTLVRAEALINPLGLNPNYNWNAPFGFYVFGGAGVGWVVKYEPSASLSCRSIVYDAGLHLWARITDGLQFFIEPRYQYTQYRIPYTNVSWHKMFGDNGYHLNMGLTVQTRGPRHRRMLARREGENSERGIGLNFGVGGGTNFRHTRWNDGSNGFGYNGQVFAEYFPISQVGLHVGFEYMAFNSQTVTNYNDWNAESPSAAASKVVRRGMIDIDHSYGILSVACAVDMLDLCTGHDNDRRWGLVAYTGPMWMFFLSESASLASTERIQQGHTYELLTRSSDNTMFGIMGGCRLSFDVIPRLGVYFSPTLYLRHHNSIAGINLMKHHIMETVTLGVQYRL